MFRSSGFFGTFFTTDLYFSVVSMVALFDRNIVMLNVNFYF
jgi:hypothetical protein